MQIVKIILYIVLAVVSLGLIAVVLMQEAQGGGMGAIGGAAEAAFGKNRVKSLEARLGTITKVAAGLLFVLCFTLVLLEKLGS